MQASSSKSDALTQASPCLLVGLFDNGKLSQQAQRIDAATDKAISAVVKAGDINGKVGETALLRNLPGIKAERLLLVGFGKAKDCNADSYRRAIQKATAQLKTTGSKELHCYIDDVAVADRDSHWKAQQCALVFADSVYQFDAMKSSKKPAPKLRALHYCVDDSTLASAVKKTLAKCSATITGIALAKDLGNLPGNVCTPTYLSNQARALAKGNPKLNVKVLGEKQMQELGMHSLLSVGTGSKEPSQLIVLEYWGKAKSQVPTVLVGKGITFDTGGISLKSPQNMEEMKYDMCGAASVLGTVKAIAAMKAKVNLVGIIAAAENMPSGKATKPGDIVTSMSGRTIEIINTDAEGRLVLCDALTYAERYKPKSVVDIATLTGACIVALGEHASGLYSNDDDLAEALLTAGESAYDRAWRMPLWVDYRRQLDSPVADLRNVGGPKGGSVTAACFLSQFAENYSWAHIDIAGTAWLTSGEKGATGRPVSLLVDYLLAS